MKVTKLHAVLLSSSIALIGIYGGIALGETLVPSTNSTSTGVKGKIYFVEGETSAGSKFDTCFKFDATNTLKVDGLSGDFTYTQAPHPNKRNAWTWQAVRRVQPGIGYNGDVSSAMLEDGNIKAQGINVLGTTFTLKGELNDTCTPSGTIPGGGEMEL